MNLQMKWLKLGLTTFIYSVACTYAGQGYAAVTPQVASSSFYRITLPNTERRYHWIATLSGGISLTSNLGSSLTLPTIDSSNYVLTANNAWQTRFNGGAFVGAEIPFKSQYAWQIGLAYYQPDHWKARGTLTQGVDAATTNQYSYSYLISTRQMLIQTKLLGQWRGRYHPYVLAGVGEAYNSATDYEVGVSPFLVFTPQFNSHLTKSFTYLVGVGMDMDIAKHTRLGASYRFADLGKANLGPGVINTYALSSTLGQQHLYANELMADLTYIFE